MRRVLTWICRWRSRVNDKRSRIVRESFLTCDELDETMMLCVKVTQQTFFRDEISMIAKKRMLSSSLARLSPFLDSQGFVRMGGRLSHAMLPFAAKHPLLLPKQSHVTTMIIRHIDLKYLHAGPHLAQSILQQFWIISARAVIRSVIHACIRCFNVNPVSFQLLMAPLSAARVSPSRPFLHTGIDFAGPFVIIQNNRRGRPSTDTAYLCIFICLATKAVHLESVSRLSTDAFIAALDRFVSRRGLITDLYSDSGRNFVGAARYLCDLYQLLSSEPSKGMIRNAMVNREIKWHFNPPSAPNVGGLWEARVKSVKGHLKRVIGNQMLTFEKYKN